MGRGRKKLSVEVKIARLEKQLAELRVLKESSVKTESKVVEPGSIININVI